MKIIITEEQFKTILNKLSNSGKRRIDSEDLEWFDKNINRFINVTPPTRNFGDFSHHIFNDLLYDFVSERKNYEIETYYDADYDENFWDENSQNKVINMYWELIPYLEERYRDLIYVNWQKKKAFIQ